MKSKAFIAIAVASTFGWSAAAFAGAGHEVATPFSPNESGEQLQQHLAIHEGWAAREDMASTGAFDHTENVVSGLSTDASGSEELAASSMSDSLALADGGIYSDYYRVSLTPVAVERWDYYVTESGETPDALSSAEEIYFVSPGYDVVWMPATIDFGSLATEAPTEAAG